jgi:hypothetical protein
MKRRLAIVLSLVVACVCTAKADDALAQYVGTYKNTQAGITYVITRDTNGLEARIVGQDALHISQSRPDHFYYDAILAYIQFVRRNGTVVGLVLTQHGQTLGVPKLGSDGNPLVADVVPDYPPVVTLDAMTLASYGGTYSFGPYAMVVTVNDGHVFAQLTKQSAFEIYPSGKDQFYYKAVDALVHFNRDASGKVVSLNLVQNGHDHVYVKSS